MNALLWRFFGASSAVALLLTTLAVASDIELSLNLRYNDPADTTEGGTWSLVGLTDDPYGIASVRAIIDNVDNDPGDIIFPGGLGAVDPVDIGSGLRPAVVTNGSVLDLAFGQDLDGSVVTGIGTGAGAPGDIGLDPLYNADWSHASVLATGTFSGSGIPSFSSLSGEFTSGRVLTTPTAPFSAVPAANVSTVVRGDRKKFGLNGGDILEGDYNRDFEVDLDDWNIVHNNLFASVEGWDQGDVDDDGVVATRDYKAVWNNIYQTNLPSNPVVVPKPATTTEINWSAEIAAAFDESFNPVPVPTGESPEPVWLQVDFSIEIGNLQAHEMGFGNLAFDMELYSLDDDCCGWNGNNEIVDSNGTEPLGLVHMFGYNQDFAEFDDLQAIVVSVATNIISPTDPRAQIGQAGPQLIGSVYVLWDGTFPAAIEVSNVSFSTIGFDGKFLSSHSLENFTFELEHLSPPDRADFNDDGVVDEQDLAIWQAGYGKAAGPLSYTGDANHDGFVDGRDFLIWQRSFSEAQGNLANVPEPASFLMLALASVLAVTRQSPLR
jgi:hypothetical protein